MLVYTKVKSSNVKSMILYPFMTIGIILSIINTPIGMTNGLVTFIGCLLHTTQLKLKNIESFF